MWRWFCWHLEGNAIAVLLAILFAAVFGWLAAFGIPVRTNVPNGFGPEWDCVSHGKGDSTCIKKVGKP
ncbi:hypothetical protein [Bradyrhizobium sp. HKCCYLR20261]|uniref:hypothetical protein n=1 Tax=Bradyrhizobium sp. HKCCYLR20261 TaxID=3420760 RepID=UPI003EB8B278